MGMNGVATAVVSETRDPAGLGRIQVQLPAVAGDTKEWARVVSPLGRSLAAITLDIGDEVVVAFENGDARRPVVIGSLWNGADVPPESADAQTAPWLASAECVLKILALLKPLIDVIKQLPSPAPSSLQAFDKAAVDLAPCLLMATPAGAIPLVRDLLCLSVRSLESLRDQSASPSDVVRAAARVQGVLDLGAPFFSLAGIAQIRLAVLSDPSALDSDITALRSAADALGGCGN